MDDIYKLSRAVEEAVADASPPRLAVASNDFAQAITPKLTWLTDSELQERVVNHRSLGVAVGVGGTPNVMRVPPPGLVDALRRHAEALLEALDAHINGKPLPAYSKPPLGNIKELIDWGGEPPTT